MRRVISLLIAVALLLVITPRAEGSAGIAPVMSSPADDAIALTALIPGSEARASSIERLLQESSEVYLDGAYRYETEDEWAWWGHLLSETGNKAFTSDYAVGMVIDFYNAQDGETFKWEYLDPSGSVHLADTHTYDSETDCWSGLGCGDPNDPYLDSGLWANAMHIYEWLPLGIWTVNFYDNGVPLFTEQFELLPTPSLEIVYAEMVTPTELGIGVRVTYPDYGQDTTRTLTFKADINGYHVEKTIDVTNNTTPGVEWPPAGQNDMYDISGNPRPTTPLKINLADPDDTAGVVPKFTENQSFAISGQAVAEFPGGVPVPSIKSRERLLNVTIPLPVVILHGYIDPWGYPVPWYLGSYPIAYETAYKSVTEFLQKNGYEKEETWVNDPGFKKYRTLWTPQFEAMYGNPRSTDPIEIELTVRSLLNQVWEMNWASKVNFIGHSFGGLVARDYAAHYLGDVNKLITVGTPHLGTTAAFVSAFSRYSSRDAFETAIPLSAAIRWAIPLGICATPIDPWHSCLNLKDGKTVTNISPLDISDRFLNTFDANPAVPSYSIFSTALATPNELTIVKRRDFSTSNWYQVSGKAATVLGDGYIPAISAAGFGTAIDVSNRKYPHAKLLNDVKVQNKILEILNTAP